MDAVEIHGHSLFSQQILSMLIKRSLQAWEGVTGITAGGEDPHWNFQEEAAEGQVSVFNSGRHVGSQLSLSAFKTGPSCFWHGPESGSTEGLCSSGCPAQMCWLHTVYLVIKYSE